MYCFKSTSFRNLLHKYQAIIPFFWSWNGCLHHPSITLYLLNEWQGQVLGIWKWDMVRLNNSQCLSTLHQSYKAWRIKKRGTSYNKNRRVISCTINQSSMHSQILLQIPSFKATTDKQYCRSMILDILKGYFSTRVNVQRMGSTILNVNSINLQQLIIFKKPSVSSYAVYFTVC